MMKRIEAREIMMQILYELDVAKSIENNEAKSKAIELTQEKLPEAHRERATMLITSIIDNLNDIDSGINMYSTGWKTSRMPKVDLAIMRLAYGEILYCDDVPDAVVVNEAINIAKKYSTEKSAKFINGVLGAISNNNTK